jgi:hypothetical protein
MLNFFLLTHLDWKSNPKKDIYLNSAKKKKKEEKNRCEVFFICFKKKKKKNQNPRTPTRTHQTHKRLSAHQKC